MNDNPHTPDPTLGPIQPGLAESMLEQLKPHVLPRMAQWASQTIRAMPPQTRHAAGYRDLEPDASNQLEWRYPHSNSAERITALLWLGHQLKDPALPKLAIRYANAMINDPLRGIYQGDEADGVGQVWYWRDVGVYMTNYTMRVPPALFALCQATDNPRYREVALMVGDQLRHSQHPTGMLREGWQSRTLPPELSHIDASQRHLYLSPTKINSRIGYVALAFAHLYTETQSHLYADALDQFLQCFERYQNPDGSFPQDIRIDRHEVLDPAVKGHFMHYILNGMAQAACLMPQCGALGRIAERLGHHLMCQYKQSGVLVYGNLDETNAQETRAWHATISDGIYGLAWLTQLTGNPNYREMACRIAINALLSVWSCPDQSHLHGALPQWYGQGAKLQPYVEGHYHFWTLLGLKALEDTAPTNT